MSCQILAFPAARATRTSNAVARVRDNVVSLSDWRDRTKLRRTSNGVFFTTLAFATAGDAA